MYIHKQVWGEPENLGKRRGSVRTLGQRKDAYWAKGLKVHEREKESSKETADNRGDWTEQAVGNVRGRRIKTSQSV